MSCRYKDQCPSYDGWCDRPKQDFSSCVSFLITAYENEKNKKTLFDLVQQYPNLSVDIYGAYPIEGFVVKVTDQEIGKRFAQMFSKEEMTKLAVDGKEIEHSLVRRVVEIFQLKEKTE